YPMCEALDFRLIRIPLHVAPPASWVGHPRANRGGDAAAPIPSHPTNPPGDTAMPHPADPVLTPTTPAECPHATDLARCFEDVLGEFDASEPMRMIASGRFGVGHYKEYLRQVFHYARFNPQLLATASSFLRGQDRDLVGLFLRHSLEEVGHESWALKDLEALGDDVSDLRDQSPLPETVALSAFAYYQLVHGNPISHLGYLYFLEFLPTARGAAYLNCLTHAGVPPSAMTFLQRHAEVDVDHNRLMQRYLRRLIHDETDLLAVKYGMRATARLYAQMLGA